MARIVIFGGQGYLGQNLIKGLEGNHNFLTLGRSREKSVRDGVYQHISIYDSDLIAIISSFKADYFIVSYYGNPLSTDISEYVELNNFICSIYLKFSSKPKIIFFSSQLVYGKVDHFFNCEEDIPKPAVFYAQRCLEFENVIIELSDGNYLNLRVPIVYGGSRQDHTGYKNLVSVFIGLAISGNKLKVFGEGRQTRSFIHIEDLVSLLDTIFSKGADHNILNACFGDHYSIRELALLISSKFKVECETDLKWPEEMADDFYNVRLDSSKALKLLKAKWNLKLYINSI
uniref:NAD-dependent epimerase/dehydratase family protein n=1 Tax=Algoriphagus sp. TaxID=1872435 RepID=UPI00404855B1